jgi:hypothetical protein
MLGGLGEFEWQVYMDFHVQIMVGLDAVTSVAAGWMGFTKTQECCPIQGGGS